MCYAKLHASSPASLSCRCLFRDSSFEESWKKAISNIDPSKTPSHFMHFCPAGPSSIPSKIIVNFVLSYASQLSSQQGNEVTKYFVSSGFVFIHANSVADVIAIEAFPIDHIDQSLVQKGLTEFTQKLTSATTDLEKAEAQIGIDVHMPLILLSLANALLR